MKYVADMEGLEVVRFGVDDDKDEIVFFEHFVEGEVEAFKKVFNGKMDELELVGEEENSCHVGVRHADFICVCVHLNYVAIKNVFTYVNKITMLDLFVIYTLLADAALETYPHIIPPIEYEQGGEIDERRREFEEREKIEDEIFFRTPDVNKDRNPYYFPNSTIPK